MRRTQRRRHRPHLDIERPRQSRGSRDRRSSADRRPAVAVPAEPPPRREHRPRPQMPVRARSLASFRSLVRANRRRRAARAAFTTIRHTQASNGPTLRNDRCSRNACANPPAPRHGRSTRRQGSPWLPQKVPVAEPIDRFKLAGKRLASCHRPKRCTRGPSLFSRTPRSGVMPEHWPKRREPFPPVVTYYRWSGRRRRSAAGRAGTAGIAQGGIDAVSAPLANRLAGRLCRAR